MCNYAPQERGADALARTREAGAEAAGASLVSLSVEVLRSDIHRCPANLRLKCAG